MSGMFLEGARMVSEGCLDGIWRLFRKYQKGFKGVWNVSENLEPMLFLRLNCFSHPDSLHFKIVCPQIFGMSKFFGPKIFIGLKYWLVNSSGITFY